MISIYQATFTAEAGPKSITFTTPVGNYALVPAGIKITDGDPSDPVALSCDPPVPGNPNSTVNVYASGLVSGVVTLLVADIP